MHAGAASLSRRRFLTVGVGAAAVVAGTRGALAGGEAAAAGAHRVLLRVPAATSNGARVPVVVDMAHPMEPGHLVTGLHVVNPRDPVPDKGTFHFSPANGRAYVAFQARFDEGPSTVSASATCSRDGRFTATAPLGIAAGGGGCAGIAPPAGAIDSGEIRPPVIRIPQLVAEGHVSPGDIVDVQVKTKHPSRTGLIARDGQFIRGSDPFHLSVMEVFYDDEPVSRFLLTSAVSDNPLITFKLRLAREAVVRVRLTNTRGHRFETGHPIRFA